MGGDRFGSEAQGALHVRYQGSLDGDQALEIAMEDITSWRTINCPVKIFCKGLKVESSKLRPAQLSNFENSSEESVAQV